MNRFLLNSMFKLAKREINPTQKRNLFFYGPEKVFECQKETNHAREHGVALWRKLTYFIAIPSVVVTSIWIYFVEKEHGKHPRPPFVEYEWVYNRKKDFPWRDGKKSLFHNPVHNALPGIGYEVPDPNEGHGHGEGHGDDKHH